MLIKEEWQSLGKKRLVRKRGSYSQPPSTVCHANPRSIQRRVKVSEFFVVGLGCCNGVLTHCGSLPLTNFWETVDEYWIIFRLLVPWIWFIMLLNVTHWRMRNLEEAVYYEPWVFLHVLHVNAKPWPVFLGPILSVLLILTLRDEVVSLPKEQVCLLFTINVSILPSSGFLAHDTAHCMCRHPSRAYPASLLFEGGGKRNVINNARITCCTVNNKVLFLWSRSLCILPVSERTVG